ncbi:hypothetical protein ACF3MZ_17265 [Paenibacillaceae bacterium WGS1546]|uniref:hypothetical protein n=1 Tax=Cohnella sp. WGS1546 TaxID=3366810 RepID=UPI00372D0797
MTGIRDTIEVARSKFAGGQGTTASPYLIATPEPFNAIRDSGAYRRAFRLIADIDLSAYASANGGRGWEPVYLEGSLDGDGHRITGLTVNRRMRFAGGQAGQIGGDDTIGWRSD